jgi:integrase
LNELAPMCVEDVKTDAASGVRFVTVIEDEEEGRSVKTESSIRGIPIHSELIHIGFLEFVEHVRKSSGQSARLFPKLTPGPKGGFGEAFSKWFGRYKRKLGITNPSSVFHSFRHGFKDALRAASVNEDINDALTGHSGGNSVARGYGWKEMVRRFGLQTLRDAVEKVRYPELDLSPVRWTVPPNIQQAPRKGVTPGSRLNPDPTEAA